VTNHPAFHKIVSLSKSGIAHLNNPPWQSVHVSCNVCCVWYCRIRSSFPGPLKMYQRFSQHQLKNINCNNMNRLLIQRQNWKHKKQLIS